MGSNFSRSGITRDLEAMKATGIGGATVFNISSAVRESHAPILNNPWPAQTYRSPAYWDALRFAAAEADRFGLEIGLHNIVGPAISFYNDIAVPEVPADQKEISPRDLIQISSIHDHEGRLEWNVPPGEWNVHLLVHAATGAGQHPVADESIGMVMEVDRMSADRSSWHWKNVIDPVKAKLGGFIARSLRHMLIDSDEACGQNWTPGLREEFIKWKGYDPVPWLDSFSPAVTGGKQGKDRRIVGSKDQTARFDWDCRDVVNQLFFENEWNIGEKMLSG